VTNFSIHALKSFDKNQKTEGFIGLGQVIGCTLAQKS